MLSPVEVTPPLSNAFKYSRATDLRCSSVMVSRVRLIGHTPFDRRLGFCAHDTTTWVGIVAPRSPPSAATSRIDERARTNARR